MTTLNHLENMLANGLRYLKRGLDAFSTNDLDFALTDFYCGLEITLKAIVLHEDWRLVFNELGDADQAKLDKGTAKTIGADQAIKRLAVFVQKPISADAEKAIDRIRVHRNKLMHFYHADLQSAAGKKVIATDLARGWHALRLLRADTRFQTVFSKHSWRHDEMDAALLILKQYLKPAAQDIQSANSAKNLYDCEACEMHTVLSDKCLLCGHEHISHHDLTSGAEYIPNLDCPTCDQEGVVVQKEKASRCTNCGASHGAFVQCEYCNDWWLEDDLSELHDGSYESGCEHCDGNAAYQMGKGD
jgi:hypothetical protein